MQRKEREVAGEIFEEVEPLEKVVAGKMAEKIREITGERRISMSRICR